MHDIARMANTVSETGLSPRRRHDVSGAEGDASPPQSVQSVLGEQGEDANSGGASSVSLSRVLLARSCALRASLWRSPRGISSMLPPRPVPALHNKKLHLWRLER